MRSLFALLIAVLCCSILFAEETAKEVLFPDHHLCLEAAGEVVVKADKAVFSFSTTAYGPTLREAVSRAKSKVAELASALKKMGVDESCLSTASFTSGKNLNASFLTDKKDYSASLSTTVSLKDLAKLDEIILLLTDNKVENLSYINYTLDDYSKYRQQAREIALNRITEQRDIIQRILGVRVTDVLLIDEAPFEKLPWENVYYDKFPGVVNTVTAKGMDNALEPESTGKGGLYTPEITVQSIVRVLYRVGLAAN